MRSEGWRRRVEFRDRWWSTGWAEGEKEEGVRER